MAVADSFPALVVGAGPAGLAAAACLKQRGVEAVVLEAAPALGDAWRHHYDRLRLHTVKEHSHLPGMPFAEELSRYPSRAEMVAYLEAYAAHFGIAPRTNEAVRAVRPAQAAQSGQGGDDGFVVESTRGVHHARAVVLATGLNRVPNPEQLPDQNRFGGLLLHSAGYRNGDPFTGRRVLVVGAGNSGAEIALDLAERGARPTLAVRTPINVVPREFLGMPTQVTSIRVRNLPIAVGDRIGRVVSRLAFGNLARYGLARSELGPLSAIKLRRRVPIIDVGTIAAIKRREIAVKPGVERLSETGAVFADGSATSYDAVILATGFRPALAEIVAIPGVLDGDGYPRDWQGGGVCPNLFFVGYHQPATGLLRQIGLDAEAVAAAIAPNVRPGSARGERAP